MKQLFALITFACLSLAAFAQEPTSPEEQEKKLLEYIDNEVKRLSGALDLEYWQEFYADSILVHDYHAMQEELMELQAAKVSGYDLYTAVQDKWNEQIYNSFRRILNDDQWAKYLKSGAGRDKKARDRRREKAENPGKDGKKAKKQK